MPSMKDAMPALAIVILLSGTALAQNMPSGQPQTMPGSQTMPQTGGAMAPNTPDAACVAMHRQVMAALSNKATSPHVKAAKHQIALGNRACAKGNTQTAQTHYQKALDLLTSS